MSPVNEVDRRGMPRVHRRRHPARATTGRRSRIERARHLLRRGRRRLRDRRHRLGRVRLPARARRTPRPATRARPACASAACCAALAFALRFGSSQILFSEYITPEQQGAVPRASSRRGSSGSRRGCCSTTTRTRCSSTAASSGSSTATRTSDHYPYSERVRRRHQLHPQLGEGDRRRVRRHDHALRVRPEDPMLAAWRKVFPGLVTTAREMPAEIRAHFRYPRGPLQAPGRGLPDLPHDSIRRSSTTRRTSGSIPGERPRHADGAVLRAHAPARRHRRGLPA